MANNLVTTEANRLLNASLGTVAYVAPTGPMKLALETTTGTNAAAGVELTGGSYVRQTVTFGSAAGGAASNSAAVTFTALPAAVVAGVEIYDSAGTPRRGWVGPMTASKTVAAGDSLTFSIGAVAVSLI
jgi:hypothetical protein